MVIARTRSSRASVWARARSDSVTTFDSGTTTIGSGTNFGSLLVIGETGTATVRFVTGANASNVNAMLGYDPTGQGTALVTGGTWTSSSSLFVGFQGSGVLDINGGYVRSVGGSALAWLPQMPQQQSSIKNNFRFRRHKSVETFLSKEVLIKLLVLNSGWAMHQMSGTR